MMRLWLLLAISFASQTAYAANDEYSPANNLGKPNFQVMGCPAGSFWDPINGGECWSCPGGVRSLDPVNSNTACLVTPKAQFKGAARVEHNKNRCTGGSFLDIGTGTCWTCPANYKRTVFPVTGGSACEKRIPKKQSKAKYDYTTKGLKSCKSGTFANFGSNKCYTCPKGWKHDPLKTVGKNGVCFKPATVDRDPAVDGKVISLSCDKGFYDPIDGGSCWTCPSGYERQLSSVKSNSACIGVSAPRPASAKRVKALPAEQQQIVKGVSEFGCGGYGRSAFFDLVGGGSCWSCPSENSRRSLYPVDTVRACMSGTCGKEGGRPCLLWERLPSCDKGLVEDFARNECRRPTNLACKVYVQTLADMIDLVEKAEETGQAIGDAALDKIPGYREIVAALERKNKELQAVAEDATKNIPIDEVLQPFQNLVGENQVLMKRIIGVAKIARDNRREMFRILTDPKLICEGDIERIAWRLNNLGIGDILNPPPTYNISVGQTEAMPGMAMAFAPASSSIMVAQNNDGILKHHRMAYDLVVTIPVQNSPLSFTLGLQFSSNHMPGGSHGIYFMHGFKIIAKAKDPDWAQLASVNMNVGWQYNGPTAKSCSGDPVYNWGVPVQVTDWLGLGLRSSCPPHYFGGFSIALPGEQYGNKKRQAIDPLEQAERMFLMPTETSTSTILTAPNPNSVTPPREFKLDMPGLISIGAGYEGGLTIWSSSDAAAGVF